MPRKRKNKSSIYHRHGYNFFENPNIVSNDCPRVFFRVFIFECPCQNEKFAFWESSALGAENGEKCKNPKCKRRPPLLGTQVIGTTPVQDIGKKLFAHFKCHFCERHWLSAHSWANTWQKCRKCEITIYPFIQRLRYGRGRGIRRKGSHDRANCQMCEETQTDCSQ